MLEYIKGFFEDRQLLLSAVAAVIALISLFQTQHQTALSNKHSLFDKRISEYNFLSALLNTYRSFSLVMKSANRDEAIMISDLYLSYATNNPYLERISATVHAEHNTPEHKEYLHLLAQFNERPTQFEFLFKGKEASLCKDFIYQYSEMIHALCLYELLFRVIEKRSKQCGGDYKKSVGNLPEVQYRKNFFNAFDNLSATYIQIQNSNTLEKIENQIKVY